MRLNTFFFIVSVSILLAASCNKQENGSVAITFTHTIDGNPVQFDELIYRNVAGNQYQLNEIKYFISKIIFVNEKEKSVAVIQDDGIHYVDGSLANTLHWKIDKIPHGHYTSVSFVFGLDENDNKSNRFVNPPECNFAWPDGGYHYMQINGKFLNKEGIIQNMNIHTGIGLQGDEMIQNYITVTLPVNFMVETNNITSLILNMEIQRWFDTPNLYNFDDFGTNIMQNQEAQKLLKENGKNVFTIRCESSVKLCELCASVLKNKPSTETQKTQKAQKNYYF